MRICVAWLLKDVSPSRLICDPSQLASKAMMYQAEGNLEQAAKLLTK
jgi:hypothetical protein